RERREGRMARRAPIPVLAPAAHEPLLFGDPLEALFPQPFGIKKYVIDPDVRMDDQVGKLVERQPLEARTIPAGEERIGPHDSPPERRKAPSPPRPVNGKRLDSEASHAFLARREPYRPRLRAGVGTLAAKPGCRAVEGPVPSRLSRYRRGS